MLHLDSHPMLYLYVAVGGVLGAVARFATGAWVGSPSGFPWATLLVNVVGSVALGALMRVLPAWDVSLEVRALLTVGFCGSFTTFSTFGYETALLWMGGTPLLAGAYVAASVGTGVAGVLAGLWMGGLLA